MIRSSCLCGAIRWEVDEPLGPLFHCHCSRCRKAHGSAFASYFSAPADSLRMTGEQQRVSYQAPGGGERCFCGRCGSVVPSAPLAGSLYLPAGNLDDAPALDAGAHYYVASKAPWFELAGNLPRYDAMHIEPSSQPTLAASTGEATPSFPARELDTINDGARGSCLCDRVRFVFRGPARGARHCHCTRCRKARSAAHASNLFGPLDQLSFLRGEDQLTSHKLPEARFFTQVFCKHCGSPMPRCDASRGIAVAPLGGLDDAPPINPSCHIFVGSKAPWHAIADNLPQFDESAPI